MYHPTTRVLGVLELLQTHGRMSGSELARRMNVDGRTLRRYITRLEEIGVPITTERGRHGAYMLVAGYKLPPMMFTDDEALALSVGLLAARSLALSDAAPAVASAQAKLERVMPANLKRRVSAIDETVALDLSPYPGAAANDALLALSAAAQSRKRVSMRYRAAQRAETERNFDPYGLAYRGGRWYVVGMCHLRNGLRSFRLDRVLSVRPLETGFTRPKDFDALGHLAFSIATLPRTHVIEVLLRTELHTAQRELFPSLGLLEQREDGVLLRAQADNLDWFARELSRLPFEFEIRRPAELRDALLKCAGRLQRLAAEAAR
ncbi:MAG TPA: YafY family protein [Steroidobacteraceae bacterium]|jgi:predicted DNA-binding transcriptional regulator YafY